MSKAVLIVGYPLTEEQNNQFWEYCSNHNNSTPYSLEVDQYHHKVFGQRLATLLEGQSQAVFPMDVDRKAIKKEYKKIFNKEPFGEPNIYLFSY